MMSPRALVRLGLRSLLLHKLRSGLSILGVVFGVAAVVAMSSVGEGARREAVAQIGALGIDTDHGAREEGHRRPGEAGLRLRDAEALAAVVPGVVAVAPVREAALEVADGQPPRRRGGRGHHCPTTRARRASSRAAGRFLADLDVARPQARGRAGRRGGARPLPLRRSARRARLRGRRLLPGGGRPGGARPARGARPRPSAPAT